MPNFLKIGQSVAKILRFFHFSRWRPPPSWICLGHIWTTNSEYFGGIYHSAKFCFDRCSSFYKPPAHPCSQRRQRQRATEGTAMAPWNGPNDNYQMTCTDCKLWTTVKCLKEFSGRSVVMHRLISQHKAKHCWPVHASTIVAAIVLSEPKCSPLHPVHALRCKRASTSFEVFACMAHRVSVIVLTKAYHPQPVNLVMSTEMLSKQVHASVYCHVMPQQNLTVHLLLSISLSCMSFCDCLSFDRDVVLRLWVLVSRLLKDKRRVLGLGLEEKILKLSRLL